jgi:hypothetical protein
MNSVVWIACIDLFLFVNDRLFERRGTSAEVVLFGNSIRTATQ